MAVGSQAAGSEQNTNKVFTYRVADDVCLRL